LTFLDTNICLDLLAKRSPWHDDAEQLVEFHIKKCMKLGVSTISIPILTFLLNRYHKEIDTKNVLCNLIKFIDLLDVNRKMTEAAINSTWKDIEDCMQYECARYHNALMIITRNKQDFNQSEIPVMTSAEWVKEFYH